MLPKGMRNIIGREMAYEKLGEGVYVVNKSRTMSNGQYVGSSMSFDTGIFGSADPRSASSIRYFEGTDLDDILESIRKGIKSSNEAIINRNALTYKKDPYATDMSTKSYIFPTRSLVNEAAQTTDAKRFTVDPMEISRRESMPRTGYLQGYYDNIGKELEKITRELDLPAGSTYKVGSEYVLDLAAVRKALEEGKRISAFKDGGFASRSIASALNNL
jgi:hypothetical protein